MSGVGMRGRGGAEVTLAEIKVLFNAGAVTAEQKRMLDHWKLRTHEDMAYRLAYYSFANDKEYQRLKSLVGAV